MKRYSGFIASILLPIVSLVACSHNKATQDELDAKVNQEISQAAKSMMVEPVSGKPLCMKLTYQDITSLGLTPDSKNVSGGGCYDQNIFLDKKSSTISIRYVEPPVGTKTPLDSYSPYLSHYTDYNVVSKHFIGNDDYRIDADVINVHNNPVIREYAPNISRQYSNEKTHETVECSLFTRIPQGFVRLTYGTINHEKTAKNDVCGTSEKILALLLDRASTDTLALKYCLTIDQAWLNAHHLTVSDGRRDCQYQSYYLQPDAHASTKGMNRVFVSIDNSGNYYQADSRYKKGMLDNHVIYTEENAHDFHSHGNYKILVPTKDHKTFIVTVSSPHTPVSKLENAAKQIALYEINHNLPK